MLQLGFLSFPTWYVCVCVLPHMVRVCVCVCVSFPTWYVCVCVCVCVCVFEREVQWLLAPLCCSCLQSLSTEPIC